MLLLFVLFTKWCPYFLCLQIVATEPAAASPNSNSDSGESTRGRHAAYRAESRAIHSLCTGLNDHAREAGFVDEGQD